MSIDMGGIAWPLLAETAAPEAGSTILIRAEMVDVETRQFTPAPVAVYVYANDVLVTSGVELGVADVTEAPRFLPAFLVNGQTCLLTTSLIPGRYVVYARYGGQVVRATPGVLRVR